MGRAFTRVPTVERRATSVTLQLDDELVARAAEAAEAVGVSVEVMLAHLVQDALTKTTSRTTRKLEAPRGR